MLDLALYNLKRFTELISRRQNFLKYIPMFQMCDKCKLSPCNLSHMFAFCSKLQNFWNSIFKILSDVLGIELIVCPLIAIFGVPSRGQPLSQRQADVIVFASLLARRRILLSWTSPQPPSISVWLKDFVSFFEKWQQFITFFNDLQILDVDLVKIYVYPLFYHCFFFIMLCVCMYMGICMFFFFFFFVY